MISGQPALRQRQPHLEPCVPRFRRHLNIAPVLCHDSLHRVEAEAGSLSDSLGGKERFKDVGPYFGGNPGAIVSDLDYDTIVLAMGSDSGLGKLSAGALRAFQKI